MNPSDLCQPLIDACSHLREGTPIVLTLTSSELVQEQVQIRKEMKTKLREAGAKIEDEIANLKAWKRTLGVAQSYLINDTEKIGNFFWEVLREEKDANHSPTHQ